MRIFKRLDRCYGKRTGDKEPKYFTPPEGAAVLNTLYIYISANAGKVKRIRNNPRVQLAICTSLGHVKGPIITGVARIVTDPQEQAQAKVALDAKYWIARRFLGLFNRAIRLFHGNKLAPPILYLAINGNSHELCHGR